ncbi:unnamed protein product [Brassica oleracea]
MRLNQELEFELKIHKIVTAHNSPQIIDAGIEDQRSEQVDSRSRSTSNGKNNLEKSKEREITRESFAVVFSENQIHRSNDTTEIDQSSSGCSTEVEKGSEFGNKIT